MKRRLKGVDFFLLAAALVCLIMALSPYTFYKTAGDHISSDGNLERLTPSLVGIFRLVSALFCLLFTGLIIWQLRSPESRSRFFRSLLALPGRCVRDAAPFFKDLKKALRPDNIYFFIFLSTFTAGTVLRFLQLSMPLQHDEAYSMAMWARSDILFAISDYHLPNNHVFNSFLMNIVYHTLGKSPALLRLPVFLSGCLLIAAVWLLGKLFYNDIIALTAAGLAAFSPHLVMYSVNARGYEIQALLSVITLGLAVYGKRKGNIFAWFLLVVFSALNFFTLPIALYPFGGICLWLFLNVCFFVPEAGAFRSRWQLFKYLIFTGLSVSVLSMLLYIPLLRYSGWNSFFGNIYIGGTEAATFGETMAARLKDNVQAFTETLPVFVIWGIAAGLLAAPFLFQKNSRERVSFGAALLLWMALLIPFQRPNLWPRTLLFLHPFLLLFASSGWYGLYRIPGLKKTAAVVMAVFVAAAGISQYFRALEIHGKIGTDEQAVRLVLEREGENARNIHFVTAAQDNAPLWIYADAYDLPRRIFDKREAFNTVYALVNPLNDAYEGPKTLDDLLVRFGPGANFMVLDDPEILMNVPDGILYRIPGREGAIRKSYNDYPAFPAP
jgi:hypothetical protein